MDDRFDRDSYSETRYPRRERPVVDGNTRYPRREDRRTISFGSGDTRIPERKETVRPSDWDKFLTETQPEPRKQEAYSEAAEEYEHLLSDSHKYGRYSQYLFCTSFNP